MGRIDPQTEMPPIPRALPRQKTDRLPAQKNLHRGGHHEEEAEEDEDH